MCELVTPEPEGVGEPLSDTRCDVRLEETVPYVLPDLPPIREYVSPSYLAQTEVVVIFDSKSDKEPPMSWHDAMTA